MGGGEVGGEMGRRRIRRRIMQRLHEESFTLLQHTGDLLCQSPPRGLRHRQQRWVADEAWRGGRRRGAEETLLSSEGPPDRLNIGRDGLLDLRPREVSATVYERSFSQRTVLGDNTGGSRPSARIVNDPATGASCRLRTAVETTVPLRSLFDRFVGLRSLPPRKPARQLLPM